MLGGQGLEIFRGGRKKIGESYRKNGGIRPVNKKDILEKPQGGVTPPPPVPARVKGLLLVNESLLMVNVSFLTRSWGSFAGYTSADLSPEET